MRFLRVKTAPTQDGLFRLKSRILRQPRESQLQRFFGAILVLGELIQNHGHGSFLHGATNKRGFAGRAIRILLCPSNGPLLGFQPHIAQRLQVQLSFQPTDAPSVAAAGNNQGGGLPP